ncbi:hypothetical protein Pla123a_24770 [Posidoniimonas polymericola]|uniref:PEP-CTERM protein-sorting domain-containing protein n=1 Tax=Posidoniimonas polymericola TaxID=2528002 RepID=A0A5C5YQH3_9BACT|nr:hypothetical protein [Posidoniimonas polymericola]TWT77048.1 hypothetical protein Pla123a_24770 [Posidoniimonas polymericola]
MKRTFSFLPAAAALTVLAIVSGQASAALLNVNIAGVDLEYKGSEGKIVDDAADVLNPSGEMDTGKADDADLASFKVAGGPLLGSWMTPPDGIYADLLIESAPASLPVGTTNLTLSGTNEFVWWVGTGDGAAGDAYLRISFDTLSATRIVPGPGFEIFSVVGTGSVIGQSLPGMSFQDEVSFSYTATDTAFTNTFGMARDGVISITGQMTPEPSTISVAAFGLLLALGRRRLV